MQIDNFKVYGLAESIAASGLPMYSEYGAEIFALTTAGISGCINRDEELKKIKCGLKDNHHYQRMLKLSQNPAGSGHCNALSGIVVQTNVTATQVWWLQMERYHFVQIVSMQSKMHCLRKMLGGKTYSCNPKTEEFVMLEEECRAEGDFETMVYNLPMGFELTARISTNYLQLKTIYSQRKKHKLNEWKYFCGWIESLPCSEFII